MEVEPESASQHPSTAPGQTDQDGWAALRRTETASTHSEEEPDLYTLQGDEPLRHYVTRTKSFDNEGFELLLKRSGLYKVMSTTDDARFQTESLGPQKKLHPVAHRNRRSRRGVNRSILGIPVARPDAPWFIWWSSGILLLDLTYTAFIIPISIGMVTSFYVANWSSILDYSLGVFFLADLIIQFQVGFVATNGSMRRLLVMNGRLIAQFYIRKGTFLIDAISTVAWVGQLSLLAVYHSRTIETEVPLLVLEALRLLRFLRVVRLLKNLLIGSVSLSITRDSKSLKFLQNQHIMHFIFIIYLTLVMINFLGCIWNFVAAAEGFNSTWINYYSPFVHEYAANGMYLTADEIRDDVDPIWLYFAGVYWALATVSTTGYGDIVPSNMTETIVNIATMIVALMFFGMLISTISESLQAAAHQRARRVHLYTGKMQSVERWMSSNSLPPPLRRRIKTYYAEVWVRQADDRDEAALFLELPDVLRHDVSWHINHKILRKIGMLRDLDDRTLFRLASRMAPRRVGPGVDLVAQGDPADRLWVLLEGEVFAVYSYTEAEHLEGPCIVGESVVLQAEEPEFSTFRCTYRSLTSATLWEVRWGDLRAVLAGQPAATAHVLHAALQRVSAHMALYPHVWAGARFMAAELSSHGSQHGSGSGLETLSEAAGGESSHATHPHRASTWAGPLQRSAAPDGAPELAGRARMHHEASLSEGLAAAEWPGAEAQPGLGGGTAAGGGGQVGPHSVMVVHPPALDQPAHQHQHKQHQPRQRDARERSRLGGQATAASPAPAAPPETRTLELLAEVMAELATLRCEVRALRDEQL